MKKIGSQNRELLSETDYTLAGRFEESVILQDGDKFELWQQKNDYAGYVIEIDGIGHEFVRTAWGSDLWQAGIRRQDDVVKAAGEKLNGGGICMDQIDSAMKSPTFEAAVDIIVDDSHYWNGTGFWKIN